VERVKGIEPSFQSEPANLRFSSGIAYADTRWTPAHFSTIFSTVFMASLHRHASGRSPFWFASYQKPDGKFTLRSTKQTDRHKAMKIALEWEAASRKARAGELTETQCRKVLSDILESTTGETVKSTTTRKYLLGWLGDVESSNSDGTAVRYRGTVERFLVHLGTKADRSLNAVSAQDIKSFMTARRKEGLADASVILDAKSIGVAFNEAKRQGLILQNPVSLIKFPRKPKSAKRRTFTDAEVRMLFDAAEGDWKTVLALGFYTTMRLSDAANAEVEHVNTVDRTITYWPKKTGDPLVVPLHDALEAHLLKLLKSDRPQKYLCPSLAGKRTGGAHGLSEGFKKIMRHAGISDQMAEGSGKRKFAKLSFHSLRHTANSGLARNDVAQEVRMQVTGHKSASMNARYTHRELEELRGAVNKLPNVTKS